MEVAQRPALLDVRTALREVNERGGWGWNESQFYDYIARGEIGSVRVGRRIRIPVAEVDRLCGAAWAS